VAARFVFRHVTPGTMPLQSQDSPLGAFLKALIKEEIECILIGAMAAIEQGAPLMTVDYDFWVRLPERQYVQLIRIVKAQGATIRARTVYELVDGTQVNAVFKPDGLESFEKEWKKSRWGTLENVRVKVLPLRRVIASKRAANREKDIAVLPILHRTLLLAKKVTAQKAKRVKQKRESERARPRRKM
jgi:hypothetical protein